MMKRTILFKRLISLALLLTVLAGFAPAQAVSYQTIRPGDQGENVRQMQRALNHLGYQLVDDGKYGSMTTWAVTQFQSRMRLIQDGLAGNRTLSALYDMAPQFRPQSQGSDQAVPSLPVETSVPQAEEQAGFDSATVYTPNGGSLNLRRTASRGQNVFYQIPFGTVLRVLGTTGQWARVGTAGRVGYVQREYLRSGAVQAPPVATASSTATPQPLPPAATAAPVLTQAQVHTGNRGSLNLRRTASRGQNVFYQIPYGTVVQVLSTSGIWSQVEVAGRVGYVQSSYLKPVGVSPAATPVHIESPPSADTGSLGTAVVFTQNRGFLNLRAQARSANNIIGAIPFGETVRVLERGGNWSQVMHGGMTGYVMSTFLRFEEASPTPTPTPEATAAPSETPTEAPTEAPAVLFPRILRPGDKGDDVRLLQEKLKALKYDCETNGVFDDSTLTAFKRFQSLNGLTVDGVMGSQSAAVLLSGSARDADSAPLSFSDLSLDSVDGDLKLVSALQQALADLRYPLNVNGRFDMATHQAVVAFQRQNGLPTTGVANSLTQSKLFSGSANHYDAALDGVDTSGATGGGPSSGQVKLLHWYNDVKKNASTGQQLTVYHPGSGLSFKLRIYSMGAHADSEPLTLRDTQLMNKAFGPPSWNINVVYVKLPDGRWTMAAMHNRPHLSGSISNNGFDGHLCVHFLRDLDEVTKNDPNYGLSNQKAIRKAWERLTGETVDK
jgi:peptidoglycan hydrolase-like protein with peptidoglycan-binding domain